ncbi:SDR family oxidoreductase [Sodalis ligni]|uniref:SDR family oxidoreductase n=1 Tax=Sodalis ligni TaxID=2697027 RepID=UPI00193F5EDB|nr:SDR family oxidoreductase [Sodalis ligni]QWA13187.1 SDR family oxidoreductase [Sodalis ligni]
MSIEGKVIVITGASSGIGRAAALLLAERGASIVLGARRSDRLAALSEAIVAKGGKASYLVTDVKRRNDVIRLVAHAVERFGKLDVLVNNAGIAPISLLDDLKVEDWEDMIDVNVKGVLYGIAAALPVFRRQGFGHFVNTLSTAGIQIVPAMAVYAGSKNAVRAISEGLRQEAGPSLRVTTISPGYVDTELPSSMTDAALRERGEASMKAMAIPAGAIAEAIAFAVAQPDNVDVGEVVVRPTAQA